MENIWSDRNALVGFLFSTNLSVAQIAEEMGVTQAHLSKEMKELGLHWVKRKTKKMSRGQSSLTGILQKILPNEKIVNEYHVGEQLRIDVYCPAYKLGLEFNGIQHYEYIAFFHDSYEDFLRGQERDVRKQELCAEQGITLLSFKYNDELTEDIVYTRVLDALRADSMTPPPKKVVKHTVKGNPYYEEMKARRREFGREMRAKMKEQRNQER